jgi:hypothetical protein
MTVPVRRILATAGLVVLAGFAAVGVARIASPAQTSAGAAEAAIPATRAFDVDSAADLEAVLAADQSAVAPDRAAVRGKLRRLAAWRRLVHATVVVDRAEGGLTTLQLDHGTVAAVSATSLTIKEAGGGSVTVTLDDETRVRRDGRKVAITELKAADEVFVMSRVEAAGTVAYLVVVPRR